MSAPPPAPLPLASRVRRWRLPSGQSLAQLGAYAPLGVTASADLGAPIEPGDAVLILPPAALAGADHDATATISALIEALPEPAALAGATLVIAPKCVPRGGLLAKLSLRRVEPMTRAVRGAALLLRGYVKIGGGVDPASGLDLAWGEPG